MDIRMVLRKSTVFLASILSIILPIMLVKYVYFHLFAVRAAWADYLFIAIAIAVYPYLSNYYFRLANRYFFSSLYDAREVMTELSDKLSSTLEARLIYRFISDTISKNFRVKSIGFLTFDEGLDKYFLQYQRGLDERQARKLLQDRETHLGFIRQNEPIVVDEFKAKCLPRYKSTVDALIELNIKIVVPLNVKDKTIGLIMIGDKESRDMFNNEDLELLEIVGTQSAIAIDNARNYEEIKNFSKKLQYEVERATEDLIQANAKLRQLDEAKSEFVSIASHQLRTPLTVIKGYISMLLEGSFGKLKDKQRDSLDKVYASNERLIQLVENLLNISRIESGRLQMNFEPARLDDMVASVVEELDGPARTKGLKLVYDPPKEKLPDLKLDREKIRQVILNLIDNAIKYSRAGEIKVALARRENDVLFSVADKGMGISEDDLADLFEKFTRGSGTPLVHTEGTGLGLYVARQMVEAHQGRIWAESKGAGQGSRFYFTIPLDFRPKNMNNQE